MGPLPPGESGRRALTPLLSGFLGVRGGARAAGGVSGPGEDGGTETQSLGTRTSPCRSASPSVARGPPAWGTPHPPREACASADSGARGIAAGTLEWGLGEGGSAGGVPRGFRDALKFERVCAPGAGAGLGAGVLVP